MKTFKFIAPIEIMAGSCLQKDSRLGRSTVSLLRCPLAETHHTGTSAAVMESKW